MNTEPQKNLSPFAKALAKINGQKEKVIPLAVAGKLGDHELGADAWVHHPCHEEIIRA